MKYDQDRVDEMTLALLYLLTTERREGLGARAWRGFDSNTMNRLYERAGSTIQRARHCPFI